MTKLTEAQRRWLSAPGDCCEANNQTFRALLRKGMVEIVERGWADQRVRFAVTPAARALLDQEGK